MSPLIMKPFFEISFTKYATKKPTLFSIGYKQWSERWDSNPRPLGPEPSALPSCATSRFKSRTMIIDRFHLIHLKHPCLLNLGR